jgi:glycosyltransferase involved in cell wall biosynthesis
MKLLVFYPYLPYPLNRGAYYRTFHLLKGLAQRHSVDLLAPVENGEGEEHAGVFREFCDRVETVRFSHPAWEKLFPKRLLNPMPSTIGHWSIPPLAAKLDEMLTQERYDAVHICDIVLAQFFLKRHRDIPLISDRTRVDLFYQIMEQQNMNFSMKTRLLNYENCVKLWFFERAVAKRSLTEIVCGPDDANFLRRFVSPGMPVEVIPNGVDVDYFKPQGGRRDPDPTIVFCGAMDYNPNIDALRWFFASMFEPLRQKVPNLKMLIVGKDPVPEIKAFQNRPGVTVTGGIPDVRPYYERAWLQIVPLRIGGGTRLKIVESLAMRTPVVSTTIGAQGLHLRHGEDILLGDYPSAFVDLTASALTDHQLRAKLERTGFDTVHARLSWPTLGRQLCDIYEKLFPRHNHSRRDESLRPQPAPVPVVAVP